jgi:hypothetical protein
LLNSLLSRVKDDHLRVRFQLALTLGEWDDSRSASALAELARGIRQIPNMILGHQKLPLQDGLERYSRRWRRAAIDSVPLEGLMGHLGHVDHRATERKTGRSRSSRHSSSRLTLLETHASWQLSAFAQYLQE